GRSQSAGGSCRPLRAARADRERAGGRVRPRSRAEPWLVATPLRLGAAGAGARLRPTSRAHPGLVATHLGLGRAAPAARVVRGRLPEGGGRRRGSRPEPAGVLG